MVVSHALQLLITGKSLAGPALKKAGDAVAGLSKKVEGAGAALSKLGAIGKTAFKIVAVGAVAAATAVAGLVTAFLGLPAAIGAATAKITDYAAELDLMRDAMWAITGDAMPAMVASLKEATAFMTAEKDILREYHMAYMLLGQDLATRIPEAMQYLTKVSALTGDTVEYLTSRLVRSVGRLSTRWMAYIGTVVTVEEAEARAAEMFGVTTDELTYQQKQAGMLDGVLQKLAARTSILPEVLGTTKQMSEALKASWKDLWAEVTTHLLPVASALYKILLKSVAAWKALVTQGGALYGPIRKVTATFTVLLEILGELLDKALEVEEGATGALERFADNVISMAWKAVQWGSNIAVNLAAGIIRGASTALIGAMNFISGLLAHWLAPGSAPLVVSNILDWGASAFTEFLRGFTMADFDILEGVQGPLKRALSALVSLEEMGKIEAGEYFVELSEMMAEAIATGDPGAVFAKLAEIPGGFGESLAELYRRQLDLGAAVERLAKAEMRLAAARKAEEASGIKLSKQAREYNKLAQAGADPAILAAKLAEVKASYASLIAAREETDAAEEEVDAEKELVKWQREQVRLQERLLNQLIEMSQAFADLLPDRDGDGDDPFVIPPIEWPEGFLVPIDTAFEELKESIRAKFAALWADLRKQWEESGAGQAVADLKERWDAFYTDTLVPIGDELGKVWATFKGWVTDDAWPWVLTQWDAWSAWWDENGPSITTAIKQIGIDMIAIGPIAAQVGKDMGTLVVQVGKDMGTLVVQVGKDMGTLVVQVGKDMFVLADIVRGWVEENIWVWVVEEWGKWVEWWEEEGPVITAAIEQVGKDMIAIGPIVEQVGTDMGTLAAQIGKDMGTLAAQVGTDMFTLVEQVGKNMIALTGLAGKEMGEMIIGENKLSWKNTFNKAEEIVQSWLTNIQIWATMGMAQLRNVISLGLRVLGGDWEGAWETMQDIALTGWNAINDLTRGKLNEIVRSIYNWNPEFWDAAVALIDSFLKGMAWKGWELPGVLSSIVANAVARLLGEKWRIENAAHQMMDALRDAIYLKAQEITDALRNVVQWAIQAFKDAIGMHSRSKVFFEFGQNIAEAFTEGVEDLAHKPAMAITHMADFTGVTAQSAVGASTEGYAATGITIHNHFGKDSVRSTQDILLIADQIQRSLELKGVRERIA